MMERALIDQQQLPVPQELYESNGIEACHSEHLRQTILRAINTDAQTRIGMFNHQQQDEIISSLPELYLRDDTEKLLGVISRYIVQLLQPTISATLGLIALRNNKKRELDKLKLLRGEVKSAKEKKKRETMSANPFELLFQDEHQEVVPLSVTSYDICYSYPSVSAQVLARTPEEALAAIHKLTQILPSLIDIYRQSEVHPDAFILCSELSLSHQNFIVRRDSIFSPTQFLPDNIDFPGFNRYRAIRLPHSADGNNKTFMQFIVRLERLIATQHLSRFRSFLCQCSLHAEAADNRYMLHDIQAIQLSVLCADSLSGEQYRNTGKERKSTFKLSRRVFGVFLVLGGSSFLGLGVL